MRPRAVFFDRDDTIIRNVPYLGDPSQVVLLPGAIEAVHQLREAGYLLILISNQSGVGRGLITRAQVDAVNHEMLRQLGGTVFRRIESCFEEPNQPGITRRKPSPVAIYRAEQDFGLDLAKSFFVGDRLGDILAGRNAGCQTVLVLSGHELSERPLASKLANHVVSDLKTATEKILQSSFLNPVAGFSAGS